MMLEALQWLSEAENAEQTGKTLQRLGTEVQHNRVMVELALDEIQWLIPILIFTFTIAVLLTNHFIYKRLKKLERKIETLRPIVE